MPKQKPNEQVQQIPLSEIRPFKNHPFKVTDDELMQQTIKITGLLMMKQFHSMSL